MGLVLQGDRWADVRLWDKSRGGVLLEAENPELITHIREITKTQIGLNKGFLTAQ